MVNKIRITEIEELLPLLDNEQNEKENIDAYTLFVNSGKELNWKCSKGHTFKEKLNVMYRRKNKCFFCTGRQIWPGENDLQTLYPELAKEFDAEKNGITADHVSPKDTNSYYWTCKEKHPSFLQSVTHRVSRKTVCPYCSGRLVLPGETDLETLFPDIASEWYTEKNDGVMPKDVSAYSYTPYWWICPKGHPYKKKVALRTKHHKPVDCPRCIKAHSTSFPEQAIFFYAKKCFPDAINRYKEPFERGMELDVYIPRFKVGIEYDGIAFHNDEEQHERELRKYQACKKLGIKLVRIKEAKDTWKDTADDIFYIKKRMKDAELSAFLSFMFSKVFKFSKYTFQSDNKEEAYLNRHFGFPTDFNVTRDRPDILEYLIDIENSFGNQHPELASMWCQEANGNVTPYMFTSGSNYPATWKCPKCGNTWKSPIVSIVSRKVKSCKECSMKENGKNYRKMKVAEKGSLAERSEILLRQWDFEENGDLSPYEIPLNYNSDVAWKCDKCGFKWSSKPNARVRKDRIAGCPHCAGRVAMPGVDDLKTLYPNIAQEWDYELNQDILPSYIKPFSNKKYYWHCYECGKSYKAYPGDRINGSGCPDCAKVRLAKMKSKPVGQFDESGNLIKVFYGLHEAAKEMQVVPNAIFQAVKKGGKSKGFYWKYIDKGN